MLRFKIFKPWYIRSRMVPLANDHIISGLRVPITHGNDFRIPICIIPWVTGLVTRLTTRQFYIQTNQQLITNTSLLAELCKSYFVHLCLCLYTRLVVHIVFVRELPTVDVLQKWDFDRKVYRKTSNIRRNLVGNKIVDHSDVVGASPVGAAPTTSSFSTWHLASRDSAKKAARQYENLLSVWIWCALY